MHPFQKQIISSHLKLALPKCKMQSDAVTSHFIYLLSISSFNLVTLLVIARNSERACPMNTET